MSWRLQSYGKLGALAALAVSFSLRTAPVTADAPTPTPTRTVLSVTASATPTASPISSPTPAATASPTATRPVATGTPTLTPSPTASPSATCTPEAGAAAGAAVSPGCAATLQAIAALITPVAHGTTPPVRSLPTAGVRAKGGPRRTVPIGRPQPVAPRARLQDTVVQSTAGPLAIPSAIQNFDGVGNVDGVEPPDTEGAVGPSHYVQWVNNSFAIWDKQGNQLKGPTEGNTLWASLPDPASLCRTTNQGDPIVLYDRANDRWFMSQFAFTDVTTPPFHQCVAVSTSGDPTGSFKVWDFVVSTTAFNDYTKWGIGPDAYYASYNMFLVSGASPGAAAQAFNRAEMVSGIDNPHATALFQTTDNVLLPADQDGARSLAAGAPEPYVTIDRSGSNLVLYEFHVDWATPANSTFQKTQTLPTAPYISDLCGDSEVCIPQPGLGRTLEDNSDRPMYRLAYRNFGDHEAMVVNHTVDVDGSNHAGVRWYELRRSGSAWSIFQQGTYEPDANHRWMGSIAMDGAGNIALGYSVSGASIFPSIRYTGRLAGDPLGVMTLIEGTVINGSAIQGPGNGSRFFERWGDYSRMAIDPVDDRTFWYTQQYIAAGRPLDANPSDGNTWSTRIAAFQFTQGITFSPALPTSLTYGAAPFTLGAVATSGQPVILGASGACRLSGNSVTTTGVGTCTVTANVLAAPGFAPASATQSIPVAPAPLQVSADNKSIVAGNPLPTFTASYSGFVNGDGPGVIQGTLVFTTTATSTSPAGAYPITVSGITAANYTITFISGTLTVTNPPGGGGGGAPAPGTGTTITGTSPGGGQFSGSLDFSQLTGNAPTSSTGTFSASQGGSLSASNVGLIFSPGSLAGTNGPVIVSIQPAGTLSLTAPDCLAGAACGLIRQALRPTVPGGPFQYSPNGTLFQVTVTDQAGNAIRTFPSPVALLLKPNAADLAMARGDPKQLAVAYMVDEQTPAIANPLRFPAGTWVFFPPSAVTQDPATGNLLVQAQVLSGLISVFSHPVGYVQVLKDSAPLLSSFASDAQTFGRKPQWSYLQVVEPQIGERLLVQDPTSKNIAYVNAADVGPSGPPPAG